MRGWIAGMLAALAACAGGYQAQTGIADDTWHELRSAHFVMRTDHDAGRAARLLADMERQYAALEHAYGLMVAGRAPPATTTEVLLFEHCEDIQRIRDKAAGFVTRTRDFRAARWLVTCA